jgi:hypothetical protein
MTAVSAVQSDHVQTGTFDMAAVLSKYKVLTALHKFYQAKVGAAQLVAVLGDD